jgi:cytochrome b involved in lipid metabolism
MSQEAVKEKEYSYKDVISHNTNESLWIVIKG